MKYIALVPAGGVGSRAGLGFPKQYALLTKNRTMLEVTADRLSCSGLFSSIYIVCAPDDAFISRCVFPPEVKILRCGGATRAQSVLNGLEAAALAPRDWVFVHDAARPCVSDKDLIRLRDAIETDQEADGAILALGVPDTLKIAGADRLVERTADRRRAFLAQTPQVFRAGELLTALKSCPGTVTDEAGAMEALGAKVRLVPGSRANFKVTAAEDLAAARHYFEERAMDIRIGTGYDLHRLSPGRAYVLGGVGIDYEMGFEAHSDGDVLIHAVIDAIFGAAALGDIGGHFPDTDPRYAGADSAKLLKEAVRLVRDKGYGIGNIDATVIAQAPKLAPYIPAIRTNLAGLLEVPLDRVSVKAKTNEGVDATGMKKAVAVHAAALLSR